jgi:glutamine synthetase
LTVPQAVKVVQDVFFNTSNILYDLNLPLQALITVVPAIQPPDLSLLEAFLDKHPSTKFLRLQYLDYTATPRMRIVPIKRALSLLQTQKSLAIGITKASLGLLQNDVIIPEVTATGEYKLEAVFSSIKPGPSQYYASVQAEFREDTQNEAALCPRSILRRTIENSRATDLEFLLGFEIEIVFMSRSSGTSSDFTTSGYSTAHAWNSTRALQEKALLPILDEINDTLSKSGIDLETWHPESCDGQYEFVLPPLPPLEAVDTLLHARDIIATIVAAHSLRATLYPKPFQDQAGSAAHVHISISSPHGEKKAVYESFYAGILHHLRSITAFTYSNPASYDRVADGCWAGGTWVTWGSQNRETALRKIHGSHWEIKCLDGLANVYLAMAAIIAAGTHGVLHKEKLRWDDCAKDPSQLSPNERKKLGIEKGLPRRLPEAIEALAEDEVLGRMLGKEAVERYIAVKRAEMKLLGTMSDEQRKGWIIDRY